MGLFSGIKNFFGPSTDYFKQAKSNQEDAIKAGTSTITSASESVKGLAEVALQAGLGLIAYDYGSGKIMTAYSTIVI